MKRYQAYGLSLNSALELPELLSADCKGPADVEIRLGTVAGPMPDSEPRFVRFDEQGAYFAWPAIGRFRLTPDTTILVDPLTADEQAIRFALLGPVLAAVLRQRAVPLLHGSAVARDGSAIAFVGFKRAGKSTRAAAFLAAGWRMLNDDLLPLSFEEGTTKVTAGFPALKLEPAVHLALIPDLPIVGSVSAAGYEKVLVAEPDGLQGQFPLAAMIVLEADGPAEPTLLTPNRALTEVLQHGYWLQFGEAGLGHEENSLLFEACARLARSTPILRLGRMLNAAEFDAIRGGLPSCLALAREDTEAMLQQIISDRTLNSLQSSSVTR